MIREFYKDSFKLTFLLIVMLLFIVGAAAILEPMITSIKHEALQKVMNESQYECFNKKLEELDHNAANAINVDSELQELQNKANMAIAGLLAVSVGIVFVIFMLYSEGV